ncbi:MAG: replicative DNA helicase [Verrucomicrobiae bacterium]|nr:replicative DNA helicase [Verrucomicrobiae bacterium]MCP5541462.1 replicative DNA helicase [Akkermansiaceae bacterium]MCP5550308.1 replicative DNA helicase [Akkermansiaceae bacterium]
MPTPPKNTQKHASPPNASGASFRGDGGAAAAARANDAANSAQDVLRSMPVSADAERAVLSCMLKAPNEAIGQAIEMLNTECFYIPANRILYQTLLDLYQDRPQGGLDLITLNAALSDRGQIEQVGGPSAVAELLDDVPSVSMFEYYAEILKAKFVLRRIIQDCGECASRAYDDPEAVTELLDEVEGRVLAIREAAEKEGDILPIKKHAMQAIHTIEESFKNSGKGVTGLSSGFANLDALTNGLHGGEMVVIAARPSMGKTSLVMNIIENISIMANERKATAVFSLEMSAEQLVLRLICSRAGVEMQKIRGGFLSSQRDFPRILQVANDLANSEIYIDDTPGLSIMELRAKARRLKKAYDIQLIAIDYLQLLKSTSKKSQDSRQVEVAEISGGIKAIAKELNIPVIVLAQLNRNPESRGGGKPKMGDLRESGAIEQDADVVGLLYREEYYADSEEEKEAAAGKAVLSIQKQRNGPTGDVKLVFRKEFMRFEDRAPGDDDDDEM